LSKLDLQIYQRYDFQFVESELLQNF